MIRRLHTLLLFTGIFAMASAQSLGVKQKQTLWKYAATDLLEMPLDFASTATSTTMTIGQTTFNTADIQEVVIDKSAYQPGVVQIDVAALASGETAIVADGALAPHLTIRCTPTSVEITAAPTLNSEVTYRLTGKAKGNVVLNGSYKCVVELNNLHLTGTDTIPALHINNGKRIDIVVPVGTVSHIADAKTNKRKSALFVKGHTEFKGGGTLNIVGNARHAYSSNEYTWIRTGFGTINVTAAVADALNIDQYLQMDGGTINVSGVGGDGIDISKTLNNDGTVNMIDKNNGELLMNGGTLNIRINADDVKGIKTKSHATIAAGNITIDVSGLGVKGISCDGNLLISQKTPTPTMVTVSAKGDVFHPGEIDESKTRGIKADHDFTLDGGTVKVTSSGKKSKDIRVGGTYKYKSGTITGNVEAG
ncbi:carbohydrate-binding domain-containing protein [Alloprevotella sp. OH1205_COT-284]|uniref:carbohydrate-binding domain-containing protein n=1 Tax=Alloprevotella sp. OH1205_COT-284 TaxID=2491043 RepID=UPI000F6035BE|nr:carbohydrate-binding domain-containing protein [Alloprevotella sp. OH1205_COT-284]RRD79950.1 carbohydrate-binding domain-containing protein [Alloprevotella sp. OH1205_COT-284]